tara:strand:- start:383 stop:985 length:603 start_codon:yes stop_codon:yes gene_type:complete
MGGTGSKPEGENKPDMGQVAMGTSKLLKEKAGAEERVMLNKIQDSRAATDAAIAFEGLFGEVKVPEVTQTEIKDLEDLFVKLQKEIDDDEQNFNKFKGEILEQQSKSLEKINLNNEEIKRVLELSNEIIKLLGNKGSSLIVPVKDREGKVTSILTRPELSDPIEIQMKKEEYLKKIGINEIEIEKFYENKKILEDYVKSK